MCRRIQEQFTSWRGVDAKFNLNCSWRNAAAPPFTIYLHNPNLSYESYRLHSLRSIMQYLKPVSRGVRRIVRLARLICTYNDMLTARTWSASCSQFSSYRYFGFELSRNDTDTHVRFEPECAELQLKQLTLNSLSSNILH